MILQREREAVTTHQAPPRATRAHAPRTPHDTTHGTTQKNIPCSLGAESEALQPLLHALLECRERRAHLGCELGQA